jgi:hypothetical protein
MPFNFIQQLFYANLAAQLAKAYKRDYCRGSPTLGFSEYGKF